MNYYSKNAEIYIQTTKDIDMSFQYRFFEKYLKENSFILDVGFGSARDLLYFRSRGYKVYGIDLEEKFVENAKSKSLDVEVADVLSYKTSNKYDAIWCCASLLHLNFDNIKKAIVNLKSMLTKNGIIYLSFKYGDFEGYIDDRYFTYINEEKLNRLNLTIVEKTITNDAFNRDIKWLNMIIR